MSSEGSGRRCGRRKDDCLQEGGLPVAGELKVGALGALVLELGVVVQAAGMQSGEHEQGGDGGAGEQLGSARGRGRGGGMGVGVGNGGVRVGGKRAAVQGARGGRQAVAQPDSH